MFFLFFLSRVVANL